VKYFPLIVTVPPVTGRVDGLMDVMTGGSTGSWTRRDPLASDEAACESMLVKPDEATVAFGEQKKWLVTCTHGEPGALPTLAIPAGFVTRVVDETYSYVLLVGS
jgi:hypothetical protein